MGLGKLWAEFKAFAFQGNMIDLAVAVVIGGAFGQVIHSLVGDVIMPSVAYAIHEGEQAANSAKGGGRVGRSQSGDCNLATDHGSQRRDRRRPHPLPRHHRRPPPPPPPHPADDAKPVQIDFKLFGVIPVGKFLTELINFIILAFAVFIMMVKLLGGVMKKVKGPEKPGEPTTRECPECLSIIPIKARRCSHCTAVIVPPATA